MASVKESSQVNVNFISEFVSHYGNHLLAVYKGLEATLKDTKKMYQDKVNALLAAWEHVTTFIATSTQAAAQEGLIEWVHRHTLNVVLQGDWPKLSPATKTHLSVTLQRCANLLSSHNAAPKCRMLVKLVNDPWGHPILKRIISGSQEITDEEVLDLCHSEMGMVLTMRLEKLCESRCEDLALRLAEVIIRCLNLEGSRLREGSTEDQILYILDVYVSLLYRFKRIQDIIKYLKRLELKDGLHLIRRYSKKDTMSIRIWKQSGKVAELAAQYFLTVAMVKPVSETGSLLKDLMAEWAILHSRVPSVPSTLPNMIRKLILPAESAIHIYTFCEVLVQQFGDNLKPICIELYIRGLTTDMNELEQQKVKHDKEKVHEAELRLSDGFLRLAELVKDNVGVCRECILTAFSLNPTRSCLEKIKAMAVASGKCPNPEKQKELSSPKNNNTLNYEMKEDYSEKKHIKCEIQVDTGQVSNGAELSNSMRMILNPIDTNVNAEKESNLRSSNCHEIQIDNRVINFSHVCSDSNQRSHSSGLPSNDNLPPESLVCNIRAKTVFSEDSKGPFCSCKNSMRGKDVLELNSKETLETKSLEIFASCSREHMGELCPHCGKFNGGRQLNSSIEVHSSCSSYISDGLNNSAYAKKTCKSESLDYDVLRQPNKVLDAEALGLTPQLCDDLAVVLSSPRYQTLSWVLDWSDLSTRCEKYLENCEEMRNTAKELKYLNIDYNQFKDWPSDDDRDNYGGIEKGYEQWAELSSDPSDQEYEYTGYKKQQRQCDSESDSSVIRKTKTRGRKCVNRLVSSESEYESGGTKKARQRVASLSISDTDTGTQDSKADSSGSDGFSKSSKEKMRKHEEPVASKRYRQDNLKDISHFRVMMDEENNDINSDLSNGDVMSLLTHVEENVNKNVGNKFSRAFESSRRDDILNQAEKKSRDPTVLKSLRMFRPHNAKKTSPRDCLSEMLKGNRHNKDSVEFAPMLSTLNLNPRIVLTRTDATHPDSKNYKNQPPNNNDLNCRKNNNKNLGYVVNKNQFPMGFPMSGDIKNKHRLQFIAQSVIESELLAKSVPGMNSLDMIVPAPSEPTVQVVQLPQNPPSNQNVNSSDSNQQKVQSSNASTTTSTNTYMDNTASSSERDTVSASTYSSQGDADHNQSYHSHSGQLSSCTAQEEKKPSNAQVSVKYLTKTNEVTDILRSSLSQPLGHSHSVTSISSQGGSLMEKKHNFQSEVKYLTSTSEVNEILRSTLIDSSPQQSHTNIAHTSSESNLNIKPRLDNEVKYLTSTNEVNEILRSTPVTAHIQKIGQPPVTSDLEQNSNSLPQVDSSQSSTQSFPIVKAVDLNFFASLISSVGASSQNTSENSASGQDSHMVQLLYKKDGQKYHIKPVLCTQTNSRMTSAETSITPGGQNPVSSASPAANDQTQNSLPHPLFDENFRKYSLNASTSVKTIPAESSEQLASLPKFQHAFGKSIYNQQPATQQQQSQQQQSQQQQLQQQQSQPPPAASADAREEARSSETPEAVSTPSAPTAPAAPAPSAATAPAPAPALSKAVQTTGSGGLSGALGVLMSPLTLGASQVVTLGPKRAAGRVRVNSPSPLLYDLQALPAGLESQMQPAPARAPPTKPEPRPPDEPPPAPMKDAGVIRSGAAGVSALLAAALQGAPATRPAQLTTLIAEPEVCVVESSSSDEEGTDAATQTLISSVPLVQRIALPVLQKAAAGARVTQVQRGARPILHLPGGSLLARAAGVGLRPGPLPAALVPAGAPPLGARLAAPQATPAPAPGPSPATASAPVAADALLAHNAMEPSVSSTTLEQLREFESVLEQVTNTSQMKERGSAQAPPEALPTQQLLLTQAPATVVDPSAEFATSSESSSASTFSQQFSTVTTRVAYVSQAPALRSASTIPGSAAKISSPLVVVTSYCQPVASPALSVTSQSSSSPCVTPAPMPSASSNKTPPKPAKSSKSKSLKSSPSSTASKASPVPKPQQKPQEDEQTAQRIYAILDEYAEQLRNSPDLNNKPAPRRRSNPPTNPSQSSKRKKSSQTKMKLLGHQTSSTSIDMSPGADDPRTIGSEDSSSGVVQLSHVQDSPAPSASEESQTARAPSEPLEPTPKVEPEAAEQQRQQPQQPRIIQIDAAGLQSRVIMQEGTPEGEVTVSSATVLAGKPVALPLYVPGGVRQVFVPMAPGLTAAVSGRQVVMSKGAAKVIRVHQVTLPGGALQVTPAAGGVPGAAALVVRQICGGKAAAAAAVGGVSVLGQPTVKQVKLPAAGISSQTLSGVSAQPPVVLPAGTALAGAPGPTLTFDGDEATMERMAHDEGASEDGALARDAAAAFSQSASVAASQLPADKSSFSSASEVTPVTIKTEDANALHSASSNLTNVLCALKTENCQSPEDQIKKEPVSSECSEVGTIKTDSIKQEVEPELNGSQSLVSTYQCLNLGFARQTTMPMRSSNNLHECLTDTCDIAVSKATTMMNLPACSESESDNAEDSLPGAPLRHMGSSAETKRRLEEGGGGGSSSSHSATPVHSLDKIPSSQLLDNAPPTSHVLQADPLTFAGNTAALDSNSLNDDLFRHEAARVSMTGHVLKKEDDFVSGVVSGGDSSASGNRTLGNQDLHSQAGLQHTFCSTGSTVDSSSTDLHMRVTATDLPLQRASGASASKSESCLSKTKGCKSNPAHLDFASEIAYISSKYPYQLEYVNDVTYQLPSKLPAETRETPWRYVPVVKRVQLIQMRKSELDRSTELGPALALESEAENSPPGAGGCLLDPKAEPSQRRACATATPLYRKIDGPTRLDKADNMQQKLQMEKELKLQKSLSEECEDLGVDEPSTSDLFPEADLLLDTNSSPPFDQNIPDATVSSDVQETDSFSCSNFRTLEYSSSSQDGSQQGSPLNFKRQEGSHSPRRMRKRPTIDWKSRVSGREKSRHINSSHREGKLNLSQDCSINGSSHKDAHIHDEISNLQEDSSNGGSKDDLSESTSGTSLESTLPNRKKLRLEKEDENGAVHTTSQTLVNSCITNRDLQVGESVSKDGILSETGNLKQFGVVSSKVSLPSNSRTNAYSTCNDDIANMFDSYASNMMLSSLDVTIPSPVPNLPSLVGSQTQGSTCSQDPLPSLTAAQKFSNTYGKRALSGRQEVDRVVKRTRLHRPNQYFNDHIDSQETWESSSSQEKTCADDEDSGSQSRTEGQSSTPDQPNSDVDVVDISNDSFPSSTTSFLPTTTSKISINSSESFDKAKPLNINGIDLKDSFPFTVNKDLSEGKKVPNNKRVTRKTVEPDTCGMETGLPGLVGKRRSTSRSNMTHLQKLKTVFQLKSSKSYVPTKQSQNLASFSENRKLIVRARKVEECGYLSSVSGFTKPVATAVTQDEETDALDSPRSQLLDKDSVCPVASSCETQLNTLSVSRRSSLRGHIKKGCTCCSVSPQPAKKKKEVLKVDKPSKKGPIKGTVTKKR